MPSLSHPRDNSCRACTLKISRSSSSGMVSPSRRSPVWKWSNGMRSSLLPACCSWRGRCEEVYAGIKMCLSVCRDCFTQWFINRCNFGRYICGDMLGGHRENASNIANLQILSSVLFSRYTSRSGTRSVVQVVFAEKSYGPDRKTIPSEMGATCPTMPSV